MIEYENIIDLYDDRKKHDLRIFMEGVAKYFENNPRLISNELSIVHSIKSRMKSPEHLRQKILRKFKEGINLNKDNFFSTVTDLAGVRILHLYQKSFGVIDELIRDKIKSEDWVLGEKPKAYCWDPESKEYFEKFELDVHQKPTYYTSVHYLLKPRADS
jgi:putative GTP pyrophosphokinase